jgi:hypothetical protein
MNYSSINNKQNLTPEEIIDLISKDLKEKFNLVVNGEYYKDENCYQLKINNLLFTFFNTQYGSKNKIEFYDVPFAALKRHNDNKKYLTDAYKNSLYYIDLSTAFCFLYEYIKNMLAEKLKSKINSEGAGIYTPMKNKKRFDSFNDWMDFCEAQKNKELEKPKKTESFGDDLINECLKDFGLNALSTVNSVLRKTILPSKEKIIKTELGYFPQLRRKEE